MNSRLRDEIEGVIGSGAKTIYTDEDLSEYGYKKNGLRFGVQRWTSETVGKRNGQ
jgi:hypothetical protein